LEEKKLKKIKNSFGVEEKLRYHLWALLVYLDKERKKVKVKLIKDLTF
jgi:hypothetical protein